MGHLIQNKDDKGNKLYPITVTDAVVDKDGVTLTEILKNGIGGGGSGTGLQYAVERTAYPTRYELLGYTETLEISDEERAYNIETCKMVWDEDQPVFISNMGSFLSMVSSSRDASTGEGYVKFNNVLDNGEEDILSGLISYTIMLYSNGDAICKVEQIQTGGSTPAPETKSDFNKSFSKDF